MGTGGFAGPSTPEVQDALRLRLELARRRARGAGAAAGRLRRLHGRGGRAGAPRPRLPHGHRVLGPGIKADARGSAGCGPVGGSALSGIMQWTLPFGAVSAANWLALDRPAAHVYEFGLTREQLAQIALNGRRNARAQPQGHLPRPDDARRLHGGAHDLERRCASTTATRRATGRPRWWSRTSTSLRTRPPAVCHVNAIGTALRGRPSWDQFDDMTRCRPATPPRACGSAPS